MIESSFRIKSMSYIQSNSTINMRPESKTKVVDILKQGYSNPGLVG